MILRSNWCLWGVAFVILRAAFAQPCDCGVSWKDYGNPTGPSFNKPVAIVSIPQSAANNRVPALNQDQAEVLCYTMPTECDTVLYKASGTWFYLAKLIVNPPFNSTFLGGSTGLDADVTNNPSLYSAIVIDRYSQYPCTDPTLDVCYFYFQSGARQQIEQLYPPNILADGETPCWHPAAPSDLTCTNPNPTCAQALSEPSWQESATQYWETAGFNERYSPNADCTLLPTIWTEESYCKVPQLGCFRANCDDPSREPCDGNGYCVPTAEGQNFSTPFHCQCKDFPPSQFGGISEYVGIACEHDTSSGCRYISDPSEMCHGNNDRCVSISVLTAGCSIPGWNDVEPRCDCDSPPAVDGTGDFCEINRCDPTNDCQVRGVTAGECVYVGPGPTDFACQCDQSSVGQFCQQDAGPCIATSESILCHGAGTCMPSGENPANFPTSTYPNFNASHPWCACTGNVAYGPQCQFISCSDPPVHPPNHGSCDPSTGDFETCLPPFSSSGTSPSGPLCDIDLCKNFGNGTSIGNPPYTCNCSHWQQANLGSCNPAIPGAGCDVTCYPRCPTVDGVVCGTHGLCDQTQNGGDTQRYAQCECPTNSIGGQGYIAVVYNATTMDPNHVNNALSFHPPVGQSIMVCEAYCVHGTVDSFWTSTHLTPCLCSNTGYDTNIVGGVPQNPRCDHKVCQNGGVWNTVTMACDCPTPYTSASNCAMQNCDNLATPFVEGTTVADPLHPGDQICACNPPYTFSDYTHTDCLANLCSPGGVVNASITRTSTPAQMCVCSGVRTTVCSDPSGATCSFCTSDECAHQGFVDPSNNTHCLCLFPYIEGALCTASACSNHSITESSSCQCLYGFGGATCDATPCVHGSFSDSSHSCQCVAGFTGSTCSTATAIPSSSSTALSTLPSSSSTGHSSSSSSSSSVLSSSSSSSSSSTGTHSSSSSSSSTAAELLLASSSSAVAASKAVAAATSVNYGAGGWLALWIILGGLVLALILGLALTNGCQSTAAPGSRRRSGSSSNRPPEYPEDEGYSAQGFSRGSPDTTPENSIIALSYVYTAPDERRRGFDPNVYSS